MNYNNTIILLVMVNVISGTGYSLVAPLFPSLAFKRGLSEYTIGFIISSYAISNLIITPFGTKIFKLIGKRNVFLLAIATEVLRFYSLFIFCIFLLIRLFVLWCMDYLKMLKIDYCLFFWHFYLDCVMDLPLRFQLF